MKTLVRCCALGGAFILGTPLPAQNAPDSSAAAFSAMHEALAFRVALVTGIVRGTEPAAAALGRLQTEAPSGGVASHPDADFAFAAIDVGQRLVAKGKPVDAELFFRAAETSLHVALQAPAATAREQAQALRKLALIRGRYLNQVAQAKADLERAIALQPEDKALQRARDALADGNAEHFENREKN